MSTKTQVSIYSFFMMISAVIGVSKLTIYAKLLTVYDFGIYSWVLSGYVFMIYAGSLGLNDALVKLGSMAYGKQDLQEIQDLYGLGLLYTTCGVLSVTAFVLVTAWLYTDDSATRVGYLLMSGLAIGTLEFNLVTSLLRVNHKFVSVSLLMFAKSLFTVAVGWHLAPQFGVVGIVMVEVAVLLFLATIGTAVTKPRFNSRAILKGHAKFKNALPHGLPIMISSFLRNLALNVDRWVMLASLGVYAVAKYSFAMILYQAAMVGLSLLSTIVGTRLLSDYGRDGNLRDVVRKVKVIVLAGLGLATLLAWPTLKTLFMLVNIYFGDYAGPDFEVTLMLVYAGVVFFMAGSFTDWIFIASSNEKILLKISSLVLAVTLLLLWYCYYFADNVYIFAMAFLVTRIINFLLSSFMAYAVLSADDS